MRPDRTEVTAIAAVAAARNEQLTIAAGSLAGERRAAFTRLVMILLIVFAAEVVPRLHGHREPPDVPRLLISALYLVFASISLAMLARSSPEPSRARFRPLFMTILDFGFVTFQAASEISHGDGMQPEMTAAVSAILISFTIVRPTLWHVAVAVGCATVSYSGLAFADGTLSVEAVAFVNVGFWGLGVIVALTNQTVRTMFRDLRRRDNLTRFLPQAIAERILRIGPEALAPVLREVTVMFTDIRGFTSLSEDLQPREVLELLDVYFERMAQVVKGHDGVVGKFIGDGIMAFWNVPDRDPDHARKAVRAAQDMLRALAELNAQRATVELPPIRIGIGIHTGSVAAGMLGGAGQSEYTIIGDPVNVASRIEALTKTLGVEILVSEATWSLCGDRVQGRRLAAEEIRGRKEPVVLFAVDSDPT